MAQVSSSVGMVVNVQWSQIRDSWLGGGGGNTFRAPRSRLIISGGMGLDWGAARKQGEQT
jgi:hypothetical protein